MAGTFTYTPDAVLTQAIRYNTLITNTTYGEERRRNKWANPKRQFSLQYNNVSGITASGITSFFRSKQNWESFSWTNPIDNTAYTVRFTENSIKRDYIGEDRYNMNVSLVEVL